MAYIGVNEDCPTQNIGPYFQLLSKTCLFNYPKARSHHFWQITLDLIALQLMNQYNELAYLVSRHLYFKQFVFDGTPDKQIKLSFCHYCCQPLGSLGLIIQPSTCKYSRLTISSTDLTFRWCPLPWCQLCLYFFVCAFTIYVFLQVAINLFKTKCGIYREKGDSTIS